jgi:anti-sigma B factor antagonist
MASRNPPHRTDAGGPDPSELLDITVDTVDKGIVTVTVAGEIDLYTAPGLDSALSGAIDDAAKEDGAGCVVVDVSDVTFMASSGLAALLAGLEHAQGRRCELRLAGGGRAVRRTLEAAGLEAHFDHYPSAAAAVQEPVQVRMVIRARRAPSTGRP